MLRETFGIIGRNWSMYLVVVIAVVAIAVFDEVSGKTTSSGATTFMWSYLAMCVQGAVIYSWSFAEIGKRAGFGRTFPYFLKTLALLIAALGISLPIFMFLPSGLDISASVLIYTFAALIAYALVLSLFGTWPVSSITGVGTSLLDALRRGVSRLVSTLGRLIAAIVLPAVLSILLVVLASHLSISPLLLIDGKPNVVMLAISAIAAFLQALSVSYAAVALARIYLSGEQGSVEFGAAAA
ncbi:MULTISPECIES: hypothetical protein [unclassified Rhizobium]|uniref:hypothetical protein n=1 Tax=unclassified Rhizobium TaxID=2613769 RepID=UPI00160AF45B|nr:MULTISPECIES: hypothetical protein [unclassified Rhizobium]MBB3540022.1 hypothetical protein [Rhizobium sp. BK399]MCS3738968.1 hypothetical protein [Rhizobium sp. BK661]MCS4090707.1 hypothetical protein [Rhizobium sp. BK176]